MLTAVVRLLPIFGCSDLFRMELLTENCQLLVKKHGDISVPQRLFRNMIVRCDACLQADERHLPLMVKKVSVVHNSDDKCS
jgi:hypothetical protein